MRSEPKVAVIGGIGAGLGFALARALLNAGYRVGGLARSKPGLAEVATRLNSERFLPVVCDLGHVDEVDRAFSEVESHLGEVRVYIHNAAWLLQRPFVRTSSEDFDDLWRPICLGAAHGAHRALPGMLAARDGAILFIGATASAKGGAEFSAFSSAKFALRGLAQSLARELGPQGIHVGHLIVDGIIWSARVEQQFRLTRRQCLDSDAVAASCLHFLEQHPSAWTHEFDLRPDVEPF